MWSYWFTFIFCLAIVLLAIVIIPWIIIVIGSETIRERKLKPKNKQSWDFKSFMKLTGALLAFATLAVFLGYMSVPYIKDFPHVIQRNYSSGQGFIEYVDDLGKSWENEVEVNGEWFESTKIESKHVGRYMTFDYLPHTKLIVSYKLKE
ncbi:hypothetical protein [Fredinandcohnia aciditolerans]|uniref:hypothetical protein n=1 Tax=Ferdinandcohnia sp. SAFN-114 TaxID=3387275 RepID=UPI000EACCE77